MSHFTRLKTSLQNLFYLKTALNKLEIDYKPNKILSTYDGLTNYKIDLIIPQKNGSDISFCWNKQEYTLVADLLYWDQQYSVQGFLAKIGKQYAHEVIVGESKKLGFQPVKYQQNVDGSNTIILERFNNR